MKNIFSRDDVDGLIIRINHLGVNDTPRWGTMDSHQMICHLYDQLVYCHNHESYPAKKTQWLHLFIKFFAINIMPIPRGVIRTSPEMLITKPGHWDDDCTRLTEMLLHVHSLIEQERWARHPAFGAMSGAMWARLIWRHVDHHLRQFRR